MPPRDTDGTMIATRVARLARWAALSGVWLVAACAAIVDEPSEIPDSVAAVPLDSPPPRSEPPRGPIADLTPAVNDDPEQLVGLDDAGLEALLGKPAFRREDTPALVWQYRTDGCVFDIFLYTDGAGEPHRAIYYEARGDATGETVDVVATRLCFRNLLLNPETG